MVPTIDCCHDEAYNERDKYQSKHSFLSQYHNHTDYRGSDVRAGECPAWSVKIIDKIHERGEEPVIQTLAQGDRAGCRKKDKQQVAREQR
jgi:hypothetical protein